MSGLYGSIATKVLTLNSEERLIVGYMVVLLQRS